MKIARILAPVHALGPGERVCLWTQGCRKNCDGCISGEMKPFAEHAEVPLSLLKEMLKEAAGNRCDALTVSGGDPFEQPEELLRLLIEVRSRFSDILVYTGYLYEDIRDGRYGKEAAEALKHIDVLIDGPYIKERNDSRSVLRGSSNQRILYLNPDIRESYETYMKAGRITESFLFEHHAVTAGILNREGEKRDAGNNDA